VVEGGGVFAHTATSIQPLQTGLQSTIAFGRNGRDAIMCGGSADAPDFYHTRIML